MQLDERLPRRWRRARSVLLWVNALSFSGAMVTVLVFDGPMWIFVAGSVLAAGSLLGIVVATVLGRRELHRAHLAAKEENRRRALGLAP